MPMKILMQKDKSWGFDFFIGIFRNVCAVSTKLCIFCHFLVNFGEFCESFWSFDRTERGDESDEVPYCSSIDDFAFYFLFLFFFANFVAFWEKFISPSLKVVWLPFLVWPRLRRKTMEIFCRKKILKVFCKNSILRQKYDETGICDKW